MCPPKFFVVNYVANVWMKDMKRIDLKKANTQWGSVKKTLSMLGGRVYTLPAKNGLCDQVFSANVGIAYHNMFLKSNFKYTQRRKEAEIARLWFSNRKFAIKTIPEHITFEGMGDVIFTEKGKVALGYGFRSSKSAKKFVESIGIEVPLHLRLVDPRFYHLDTCFVVVNDVVLYYPKAFDAVSQRKIKNHFVSTIAVSEKDALGFVCNGVPVGKKYVTCKLSANLKSQLGKYGIEPIEVNVSEFLNSGGAVRCMVLDIN